MKWSTVLGFGCPDCQTRIPLWLMMGISCQDGPGGDCNKQPPESQRLIVITQKQNLFLYVHLGSVGALVLSFLQDPPWQDSWYLWDIASQHGREHCAAHTRFLKCLPQRDIHNFHPDSTGQSKSRGREVQWYHVPRRREKPRNCEHC